ncbi:MAG: phosphate ABC transporter permease PstA [Gemmiger sp.]|nr:phosphate ABC transporter permease PstA [Gemmiger sp.]
MPDFAANAASSAQGTLGADGMAMADTTARSLQQTGQAPRPSTHRNRLGARLFAVVVRVLVCLGAFCTAAVLLLLVGYILIKGVPNLSASLFSWTYTSDNVSLMPALLNTLLMTFFSLLIATPLGIFAAVYLVEYARRGNRLVKLVRITTETLQGIPSIVYGLFGMLFFVTQLHWGLSLLSGAFTLAIMILPLIMRTTEESLLSVPDSFREGSFGLGAGKLRTVFSIVLPSAMPGILSGVILGTGRIVGETAALMYTAGTVASVASGSNFLFDSTRTLSVHMYLLSTEGLHVNEAFGTAVVLLVLVLGINALSSLIANKLAKGNADHE